MLDTPYSLVFINTPLPDETGAQLALDLSSSRNCCVALLVSGDSYDQVNEQVEDAGVLTLSKPCTAQQLKQAAAMMSATRFKLFDLEHKTATLEEKMEEIRLVNRAKWMLIERRGMDEATAHRYIEKLAMDARQTRRLVRADADTLAGQRLDFFVFFFIKRKQACHGCAANAPPRRADADTLAGQRLDFFVSFL